MADINTGREVRDNGSNEQQNHGNLSLLGQVDPRLDYTNGGKANCKATVDTEGTKFGIDQVNQDRQKQGLKPVKEDPLLDNLAQIYAYHLAKTDSLSHNDSFGRSPFDRMNLWGVKQTAAAENLGQDMNDAGNKEAITRIEKDFMSEPASLKPSHRGNILDPDVTNVGVGVAVADNGKVYVVQEFTRSADAAKNTNDGAKASTTAAENTQANPKQQDYLTVANPKVEGVQNYRDAGHHAIEQLNAERQKLGLQPLVENDKLDKLADAYSSYMLKTDTLDFKDPYGRQTQDRANIFGVKGPVSESMTSSECIKDNNGIVDDAAKRLLDSAADKANLMNPKARYVGAGFARSGNQALTVLEITGLEP